MKKIYFLALSSLVVAVSFGQSRTHKPAQPVNNVPSYTWPTVQSVPTDTLWGIFPLGSNVATGTATPTMYSSTGGGFVAGNNGYGDIDKAQAFVVANTYTVEGCIFWFGAKIVTSGNPNSKVVARIYDMDGTGTLSTGPGTTPNTVVASTNTDILVSAIDTAAPFFGFVNVTFPTPFPAGADYAVGLDLTTLAPGDSVGLVTSTSPQSGMIDQSFDKWSDNTWHSFFESGNWSLDIDMAIFPVINDPNSSVSELGFINGIKLYQNYPNPFSTSSVIAYELESSAKNVTFFINDLDGRQVKKIELGNVSNGKHTLDLSAVEFSSGTYFVLVQADQNRIAKKMTIAK